MCRRFFTSRHIRRVGCDFLCIFISSSRVTSGGGQSHRKCPLLLMRDVSMRRCDGSFVNGRCWFGRLGAGSACAAFFEDFFIMPRHSNEAPASEGASAGVSCRAFTRASASAGCFCSSFGVERWCGSEDDLCRLKLETCFEELHIKHTPERSPQAPTDRIIAMLSQCRSSSPSTGSGRVRPIRRTPSRTCRLEGAPRQAPAGSHLDQTTDRKR